MEMKVTYSEDKKTAFFDGYKFRKDAKTGYYLANKATYNGRRERLHVYVWRYFNGPIPDGYHVHHKDENKEHNDIENLACISGITHSKYHLSKYVVNHREEVAENLARNVRPKASEWHKSEAGREWHKKHWETGIGSMKPTEHICQYCGKAYMSIEHGNNLFCSNNCRAAARRKSGVDDETRRCAVCGKEFSANKYANKKCCSRECRNSLRRNKRNKVPGETAGV